MITNVPVAIASQELTGGGTEEHEEDLDILVTAIEACRIEDRRLRAFLHRGNNEECYPSNRPPS
jgi:hypothetical protein